MPARALLVLLVMLNLGVALWWALKPPAPPVPARPLPADVPRLQLLGERADAGTTAPPRARAPIDEASPGDAAASAAGPGPTDRGSASAGVTVAGADGGTTEALPPAGATAGRRAGPPAAAAGTRGDEAGDATRDAPR